MDLIRATVLGILLAIIIVAYVRVKQGCFFKPWFGVNFPKELVPYIREYPLKYFAARHARIAPFLKRYNEAKEREGNSFSSGGFLEREKELLQAKKNRRG